MKIKFIIATILLFTPTICLAKTINIDNKIYNVDNILELDGISYNAKTDTLILDNANLKMIKTSNDLNIILKGENNIINESSVFDCITASYLSISGNGNLNIQSEKSGIIAEKILIKNVDLTIKVEDYGISSSSTNDCDINIINSKINVISAKYPFGVYVGDLYLDDSDIKVLKCLFFIGGGTRNIYINNTNLNIFESETIRVSSEKIYLSGNSNLFVYAYNNWFNTNNYIIDNNLEILASNDNLNYHDVTDLRNKYIKIFKKINLEEELSKLEEEKEKLNEYEEYLNNYEELLNSKEEELKEKEEINLLKEQELDEREQYTNLKQQELLENDKELNIKIQNNNLETDNIKETKMKIEAEKNDLEEKYIDLKNDLLTEKEEINKLKYNLELKEKKLKQKENELISLIELYDQNDYDNNLQIKETKNNKEVSDDIFLENCNKYANKISNNLNKFNIGDIVTPIISFFGGIITFIFAKRRNFHG